MLCLWVFPESPLFHSRPAGRPRWFYYYFLLMALVYAVGALGVSLSPGGPFGVISATVPIVLSIVGLILLIVLRIASGRDAMARVWLAGGNWRHWLIFGVAFVAYYALQAVLNAVFNLGGAQVTLPAPLPDAVRHWPGGGARLRGAPQRQRFAVVVSARAE